MITEEQLEQRDLLEKNQYLVRTMYLITLVL